MISFALLLLALSLLNITPSLAARKGRITVHLVNDSGSNIYVQWLNPATGDLIELNDPEDPCQPDSINRYNSFRNDELILYETGGDCEEVCRRAFLSLKDYESSRSDDKEEEDALEEMYVINSWFKIHHVTDPIEIREMFQYQQGSTKDTTTTSTSHPLATNLHIRNDSRDSHVDIFWIHKDDGSLVLLTEEGPLLPNDSSKATIGFETFVGNRFQLREASGCKEDCRTYTITVPEKKGVAQPLVLIEDNFQVKIINGVDEETQLGEKDDESEPVPEITRRATATSNPPVRAEDGANPPDFTKETWDEYQQAKGI